MLLCAPELHHSELKTKDLRTSFWVGSGAALKTAVGSTIHNANQPVCIVEAGPAGLTAAKKLDDRGYKTAVFEQEPLLGGECQSYYDSKHALPSFDYGKHTVLAEYYHLGLRVAWWSR